MSVYEIDYIEIYAPMAKILAYWHQTALSFRLSAYANAETGRPDISSYVLNSGKVRIVLTSVFPDRRFVQSQEVSSFITQNYCGVRRIALRTDNVKMAFESGVGHGAIPLRYPCRQEDETGYIEEAAIKLFDHCELVFIDRNAYGQGFRPGYRNTGNSEKGVGSSFLMFDHIASELRINEVDYWTNYLAGAIGTRLIQSIGKAQENRTGMRLNIAQSADKNLTFVLAEPEDYRSPSKVQQNIDAFGPGVHHLAFSTNDLVSCITTLTERNVEFVKTPASYYDLIRKNPDLEGIDIDPLQKHGILIDKEGDAYLLQKFIKPFSDRPFFLYELVQRVNGYSGFALGNINVLKKAEEAEIIKG